MGSPPRPGEHPVSDLGSTVGDERDLRNARAAFNRVHAEALVLRDERDSYRDRTAQLAARVTQLEAQVRTAQGNQAALRTRHQTAVRRLRRQLKRTQRRLQALEQSRAVRASRLLRRYLSATTAPFRGRRAPEPVTSPTDAPVPPTPPAPVLPVPSEPALVVTFGSQTGYDVDSISAGDATAAASAHAFDQRLTGDGRQLRIAAVVDDFTRQSLSLDCDLLDLHPDRWHDDLADFDADLLFVESAWRGKDGSWHNSVPKLPQELLAIVDFCRKSGIPTIFWNKEDPVHFQTFLRTAREFDHVFTTDIDCVSRYRAALGHDRVGFLPFACQPRLQNPVETYDRVDGVGFAGGYYRRYPERMRDLDALLEGCSDVPVEIWDRMYGTVLEDYRFPETYQGLIAGTLEAHEIDVAYKGYRFALNLNSVKHSQSMFARRAFELLSSGTVTFSNYARGLRVLLGDLVPMNDSAEGVRGDLLRLRSDDEAYDRLRLMGLRTVHAEHTYRARLDAIVSAITGRTYEPQLPRVSVLATADNTDMAAQIRSAVQAQVGVVVEATYVTSDAETTSSLAAAGERVVTPADLAAEDLAIGTHAVAVLDGRDWYGPTYLVDLVQALVYADAEVVGKAGSARWADGAVEPGDRSRAYRPCVGLESRSAAVAAAVIGKVPLAELVGGGSQALASLRQFSIDRFDYCRDGGDQGADTFASLLGTAEMDTGTPLVELYENVKRTRTVQVLKPERPVVSTNVLASLKAPHLTTHDTGQGVRLTSTLPTGTIDLRWLPGRARVEELWPDGVARAHLEVDGDLNLMFALRFFDQDGTVLGSVTEPAAKLAENAVPEGAHEVAVALRLAGPGSSTVRSLSLSHPTSDPVIVPSDNEVLLVTDHYPSYEDLYRNGFVHTRVRGYAEHGVDVDVFRARAGVPPTYHEFDSVEVATGSYERLRSVIAAGSYRTILVHFLSEQLWEALRPFHETHRIICWVHGAEVKPWWRRSPEHLDEAALTQSQSASERRVAFWQGLIDDLPALTSFVLVSRYFADEMQADLERTIPPGQLHIIHNPIDTDLFQAATKPASMRNRILSIRSFASPKYANDLAVAAICELVEEPWFSELEICIVGDGPLFAETVAPLRELPNVTLRQTFLTHREMAALHGEYGVFLVPTRSDTQGVSRDEAMASGLVPVTSDVEAVPEFIGPDEGYLVAPEDHIGLARAIARVREHPEEFQAKSRAAARRARAQVSASVVIPVEIALIRGSSTQP